MDKRSLYIFALVGLLLLGFFYVLNRKNTKHDWRETYKENSKEPYGTHVMYELMQEYFKGEKFEDISSNIVEELPLDLNEENANFIFVGQAILMDSLSITHLAKFIENGNNVFFSTKTIPDKLIAEFNPSPCEETIWTDYKTTYDTIVRLNLINPVLEADSSILYTEKYKNTARHYRWHYIEEDDFCDAEQTMIPLGNMDGTFTNFVRLTKGKGNLFLHTTPIVFTNIQLLEKEGIDYTSKVFSYLEKGPIYWCKAGRTSERIGKTQCRNQPNRLNSESPLKYILAQPALAWAWYLSIFLGLMFVGFRAKRKQRVIPVLEKNKNTSLEFISTIGKLYFIQNNNRNLCQEKMKLLMADIRNKYHIPTKVLDESFTKRLAAKSEVSSELIAKILLYHKNITSSEVVTEKTMVEFHQLIDAFYKKSK